MLVDFENYQDKITDIKFLDDEYSEAKDKNFPCVKIFTEKYIFILNALGDCCSVSYIKEFRNKFSEIIGKTITGIQEIEDKYDSDEESCDDDTIKIHIYEITFKEDDKPFKFLLKNYSNGYYDGWIEFEVVNNV